MAIPIKLKKRWDIYLTLQEVLTATQNLSVSPFGLTEEGLQDFRGIKLEYSHDKYYYDYFELIITGMQNCDFSGSKWLNFLLVSKEHKNPSTIENCVFNEAFFDKSLAGKMIFKNCSFDDCTIKDHTFYGILQSCSFKGIRKKNTKLFFNCDLIKDCLFEGKMRKINFWGSPLEDCVFKGTLYDCSFDSLEMGSEKWKKGYVTPEEVDNRFDRIDFSQAEVMMSSFADCYLDRVKPSPNNCLAHCTEAFFDKLCELVEAKASDDEMIMRYAKSFYRPHPRRPYAFAHPKDFTNPKEPESFVFAQRLYDLVCEAAEATNCRIK